jgi:GPH family glycoside/pentoside/hexuronide:cation symporter
MNPSPTQSASRVSTARLWGYAIGEGATSIAMGGISNFALLYYTSVLGLGAGMAGLALSISVFWDAVTDPVMGHVSDNTRSRWGQRLPYILLGGLLLAPAFFSVYILPAGTWPAWLLFTLALLANLAVRTASTIFGIPYVALGFELCESYDDRSRLQGIRSAFFMVINLVFGGLAWSLFFRDRTGPDGARVDGTAFADNYHTMGAVLSATMVVLVLLCVWFNRDMARDNRGAQVEGNSIRSFWSDFSQILSDRLAWYVFAFFSIALFGMLFVSQLQMLVYVFFMEFRPEEKTLVHGGGMVAAGLGALFQARLTNRFDKKTAGYAGIVIGVSGGVLLLVVFSMMGLAPRAVWPLAGFDVPVGLACFALGQWMWWFGSGMLGPISMSMVADISEIHFLKTGVRKDGGYSSVFSFLQKAAMSLGLLLSGWLIMATGIVSGEDTQAPEAVHRIAFITFIIGPILMGLSFFILRGYPVNRESLRAMEQSADATGDGSMRRGS